MTSLQTFGYALNPDIIREILKALSDGRMPHVHEPEVVLRHHYRILLNEGFIQTDVHQAPNLVMNPNLIEFEQLFAPLGSRNAIFYLSFDGDNFVKNIIDDTIWSRTKELLGKAGSASLPLLVEIAAGIISRQIM